MASNSSLDLSGVKILLIEDNAYAAEAMRLTLEQFGAAVRTEWNGEDALAAAREDHPDLILCDLWLPKMDGYEFIRLLRHDNGLVETRVIAVSGFKNEAAIDRTWKAGFSGYLMKPVQFDVLKATLERTFWNRNGLRPA